MTMLDRHFPRPTLPFERSVNSVPAPEVLFRQRDSGNHFDSSLPQFEERRLWQMPAGMAHLRARQHVKISVDRPLQRMKCKRGRPILVVNVVVEK